MYYGMDLNEKFTSKVWVWILAFMIQGTTVQSKVRSGPFASPRVIESDFVDWENEKKTLR